MTRTSASTPTGTRTPSPAASLPPGPDDGRLAATLRYHRDPLGTLRAARARFGDVFTLRLLTTGPVVIVTDPALAGKLARADPRDAHAGAARRRILPEASPRSVFGGDGGVHAHAVGRIAEVFSAPAIATHTDEIAQIAAAHAATWPTDRPIRLLPRLRRLTDELFVRVMLGVRHDGRAREAVDAIVNLSRTPGNPPVTVPAPDEGLLGRAVAAVYARRLGRLRDVIAEEVAARRTVGVRGGADIVGCLLRADPQAGADALTDELAVVILAGQEPPAIALARLMDRAGRDDATREALLGDDGPDAARAAAQETLRLHPPASGLLRRLTRPLRWRGGALPAGTDVLVPLAVLHRDPRAFPDPERFDPRRFGAPAPSSYLPFGDGARRCLGEHLAWAEVRTALPQILRRVDVRPLARRPERAVVRGTVAVPVRSGLAVLSSAAPRPAG